MTQLIDRVTESTPEVDSVERRTGIRRFGGFRSLVVLTALVVGITAGWMIYDASSNLSPAEIQSARWEAVVQAYQSSPEVVAQVRFAAMPAYYESLWKGGQARQARIEAIQAARFEALVQYYETHWPLFQP